MNDGDACGCALGQGDGRACRRRHRWAAGTARLGGGARLRASAILYAAFGSPPLSPNDLPPGCCAACGRKASRTVAAALPPTFNALDGFAARASDRLCEPCAFSTTSDGVGGRLRRLPGAAGFFATERGLLPFAGDQSAGCLLSPPVPAGTPFIAVLVHPRLNSRKNVAFRASVNLNWKCGYFIQDEDESVWFPRERLLPLAAALVVAKEAGVLPGEVLSGHYKKSAPGSVRAEAIASVEALAATLRPAPALAIVARLMRSVGFAAAVAHAK